jgi:methionine synthase I (cobalamin-dependent)
MDLLAELEERVLCGDGAMGTLLQLQRTEENIERSTLNIE